jgi:hypothetical protein
MQLRWEAARATPQLRFRPTITMSGTFNLNCLVLGHDASHIFPIEIGENKTVGALRKAIKDEKRHAFQHVDADTLVLWKVSIPVSRSLADNLSKFDFVDEGSLLPVEELTDVFSGSPARRHLHIVVRGPPAGECKCYSPVINIYDFSSYPPKSALPITTTPQS